MTTTFENWCLLRGVQPLPAAPADVAKFIGDIGALGIEEVWRVVGEISRAHYLIGLADPTLGGLVAAALNDLAKIDPPRAWPSAEKFRFKSLPYDLQVYVAAHEARREKEIRRAHNEAAVARQELAAIQKVRTPEGAANVEQTASA